MRKFLIIPIVFFLVACASRPIQNVDNRPVPTTAQRLTMTEVEAEISEAAFGRGWLIEKKSEGHLVATFRKQVYEAVVDITYTPTNYSITYKSSQKLIDNEGKIHHNYGRWIGNLDQDIQLRLSQAGSRKSFR